ncbi:MAG: fasciclin domain-containing protein [Pseudomonadota bacterium]
MNKRNLLKAGVALAAAGIVAACAPARGPDIVEVAASDDRFSTLVAAVQAAGLVETLQGDGPFTVFAPTNDAFAALPAGTVESLLLPENKDQLVEILTYHVLVGAAPASSLVGEHVQFATVQGGAVTIDGRDGVKVNDANVIIPDIAASNGVIHAIDSVLLP